MDWWKKFFTKSSYKSYKTYEKRINGAMSERMAEWMDEEKDGCMDEGKDGWKDEGTIKWKDGPTWIRLFS